MLFFNYFFNKWLVFIVILIAISGCINSSQDINDEYLIKAGNRYVFISDFNKTLELAKIAYPYNISQDLSELYIVKLRVLDQLIEEVLLLNLADTLEITISDQEFDKEFQKIKKDYPEDSFEKIFLENAISLEVWKKRLKDRLLIEKVIVQALESHIVIKPEEIQNYYNELNKQITHQENINKTKKDKGQVISKLDNKSLISQLKRKKAEESYSAWITDLKQKYNIEINKKKLNSIIGL